jgi:hypothetical protein
MDFYSSADEEQDLAQWLAGQTDQLGAVEAISGDEFEGAYEADVIDLATAAPAESPEVG